MSTPNLALAASARDWPDKLHRFVLDHGGALVRARVMSAEQAQRADFDVLLVDDICSFLTPRLVRRLREQGKDILGVFSPEDGPDAKRRLLECGISDVIESSAPPNEFLVAVAATLTHRLPLPPPDEKGGRQGNVIAVTGASTGVGCTEVAVALATRLANAHDTVLVDLDQRHPGIAQRLDLPLHPNLRTAVDLAHHEPERLGEAVIEQGRLWVVGGAPATTDGGVPALELSALLEDLGRLRSLVVADIGDGISRTDARASLLIGEASPVGLGRVIRRAQSLGHREDILLVINRAPSDRHRRDDIRVELARALPGIVALMIPTDRRIERASWDGRPVAAGPFARSIRRIASVLSDQVTA